MASRYQTGVIGNRFNRERFMEQREIPENLQWAILATIFGGVLGSYFGSQKFNLPTLRYLLALGLVIASAKLIFT